jgi:flagellar motor switch protein FliN/FliY
MAAEHSIYSLTEAEQALASFALPPVDPPAPAVRAHRWEELHRRPAATRTADPNKLRNATVTLRIELGRARLSPHELLELRKGSVLPLDKTAGDSVDIYADQRLAARGEVVVVGDNFGVRVVEVISGTNGDH